MKKNQFRSDFLFPDTDFLTGMGSVANVAGNYFDFAASATASEADRKALSSDWGMIFQDISEAYNRFITKVGDIKSITGKCSVDV